MRQSGKSNVASLGDLGWLDVLQHHVAFARKRRVHIAHTLADVLLRSQRAEPNPRMAQEQTQELDAGISSGAKYGNAYISMVGSEIFFRQRT
jgi:hypothetical protein